MHKRVLRKKLTFRHCWKNTVARFSSHWFQMLLILFTGISEIQRLQDGLWIKKGYLIPGILKISDNNQAAVLYTCIKYKYLILSRKTHMIGKFIYLTVVLLKLVSKTTHA